MTGANLTAATSEGADAHSASDAIWPMRRNKALWRAVKPIPDCRPGNVHRTVMAASSVASISFRRFRNGFLVRYSRKAARCGKPCSFIVFDDPFTRQPANNNSCASARKSAKFFLPSRMPGGRVGHLSPVIPASPTSLPIYSLFTPYSTRVE